MLYNIKTGYHGVPVRPMEEVVLLVSSLHDLLERELSLLFTDRHPMCITARFFPDLSHLDRLPWDLLQRHDFKKDPEDPGKVERYQTEALVYQHVPLEALRGSFATMKPGKT